MAADMFQSKIEGGMRPCRWLFEVAWQAEGTLNLTYLSWAKALIGSSAWRRGAVAMGELGWRLGGYNRAVMDMAIRRATLWCLPPDDIYGRVYRMAHSLPGPTWAKSSAAILQTYKVEISTILTFIMSLKL